jgi:hypothetical protein
MESKVVKDPAESLTLEVRLVCFATGIEQNLLALPEKVHILIIRRIFDKKAVCGELKSFSFSLVHCNKSSWCCSCSIY